MSREADINVQLYGKNDGITESGIGIASDNMHEINKQSYIQLDLHHSHQLF